MARTLALVGVWLALPAAAAATDPAARFDAPGQRHADACVGLADGAAPLRYGDGTPTGFTLTAGQLAYDTGACAPGTATLDLHEIIPSAAGPLVFHRGGSGYVDRGNVKYGELAASDLAGPLPAPVPSSGGRGAPCTLANEPPYQVDVRSITSRMHYKSTGGASYTPYGDPAADQGENPGAIHYTYLLWSWINVNGGGTVRTLLGQGQVVRACDVASITSPAYDRDGAVNGSVTARYVRALAGSCPVYGWMVWSHTYNGRHPAPVAHATAMSTTPPPDPTPDPACPVAEPASPPIVATGAAHGTRAGTTFAGVVNPKGVPTTYVFQFGRTPFYSGSTAPATLGPADANLTATAPASGLRPGAVYHYRLVAANSHGVSYGRDRKAVPPRLTGLRVKPRGFHRARKRHGRRARIVFKLSARATVTIAFVRRVHGRNVVIHGTLRRHAKRGRVSIPFSGWFRGHRLRRGHYFVAAQPRSSTGLAGVARLAKFTIH